MSKVLGLREKYNEDKFLNQTTMTVARATVFYCIILCGRRKECAAVCVMTRQHRLKLTQQHRQNNNIAEAITHKLNGYDYEYK